MLSSVFVGECTYRMFVCMHLLCTFAYTYIMKALVIKLRTKNFNLHLEAKVYACFKFYKQCF